MHLTNSTLTIAVALVSSLYLFTQSTNRTFPLIATIVAGVELLLTLGIMSLSLAKYRVDVILPALLAISGFVCWTKTTSKGGVTAASAVALIGAMQLLLALRLFS
ncbi:MAG TPA: hypothetical protein VMZ53_21945 [Kofleriaceae bacterium]|nr:hypothetical protein [Kofleriaceae bacterium]